VSPASAPVTTLEPWPRRRVRALMMLDLPVLGKPIMPTERECLRWVAVARDFRALWRRRESFFCGRLGWLYCGFEFEWNGRTGNERRKCTSQRLRTSGGMRSVVSYCDLRWRYLFY